MKRPVHTYIYIYIFVLSLPVLYIVCPLFVIHTLFIIDFPLHLLFITHFALYIILYVSYYIYSRLLCRRAQLSKT
jgi:hypothetical protein